MKIDSVDFFYLAMPEVTTAADGSQDALVVRVSAGGHVGWGECEAAPLPSIAAFVCPMSHGACRPVAASVLGETLDGPEDIHRMTASVAYNSMDLLQAAHTWSGIEMALWDVLGRARGVPAWKLLGYDKAYPKVPYASVLFGATPQQTLERAREISRSWLPRRQVRLGAVRQLAGWRHRPSRRCARGSRLRRHPADRRRADLRRGCRCRCRKARRDGAQPGDLLRGAVPRLRLPCLCGPA